eukprot:scaffold40358_cov176-Amphora_coffeaeformis.AAC.1
MLEQEILVRAQTPRAHRRMLVDCSLNGILLNPEFCRCLHVDNKVSIKIRALPALIMVPQFINICNGVHHPNFRTLAYFTSYSDLHIDKDAIVTVIIHQSDFVAKGLLPVFIIGIIRKATANGPRGHACRKGQLDDRIPRIFSLEP